MYKWYSGVEKSQGCLEGRLALLAVQHSSCARLYSVHFTGDRQLPLLLTLDVQMKKVRFREVGGLPKGHVDSELESTRVFRFQNCTLRQYSLVRPGKPGLKPKQSVAWTKTKDWVELCS